MIMSIKSDKILNGGGQLVNLSTGELKDVVGLYNAIDNIKSVIENAVNYAQAVEEENDALKSNVWKDEQLRSMKEQRDRMLKDYQRGFPISEDEQERINNWATRHRRLYHPTNGNVKYDGCSIVYEFSPTSLGTVGTAYCEQCMRKLRKELGDIDDYTSWGDYFDKKRKLNGKYDAEFEFQSI